MVYRGCIRARRNPRSKRATHRHICIIVANDSTASRGSGLVWAVWHHQTPRACASALIRLEGREVYLGCIRARLTLSAPHIATYISTTLRVCTPPAAEMVVCGTKREAKAAYFWWCDASFVAIYPDWKSSLNSAVACFTAKQNTGCSKFSWRAVWFLDRYE